MLTLRPHFELEWHGGRGEGLGVADVVGVVVGTEIGLVHAFQDGHGGSLHGIVMDIFERQRTLLD